MTPEQFCYWLQGRAELVPTPPSEGEWKAICDHLQAVFKKVTPPTALGAAGRCNPLQDALDQQAYRQQQVSRFPQVGPVFQC